MDAIADTLREDLRDKEFAEGYAESFLDTYVATQIKVLREQRELTQTKLAQILGTTQTVVSRIENVNYSSWNVRTLKKVARALDVRLQVSFETYGSLVHMVRTFDRATLQRVSRAHDPAIQHASTTMRPPKTISTFRLGPGAETIPVQGPPRSDEQATRATHPVTALGGLWSLRQRRVQRDPPQGHGAAGVQGERSGLGRENELGGMPA